MNFPIFGGCQCGQIRYSADSLLDNPHVCHCRMCQKAVGNFFAALVGVPLKDFKWTRGNPGTFKSSELVERGFCADCGTPLFFRHLHNQHISLSIGSFDHPAQIPLEFQLGMEARLPQIDQLTDLKDFGTTAESDPEGVEAIRVSNRQHPDHETVRWPEQGSPLYNDRLNHHQELENDIRETYQRICEAFGKLDIESVLNHFVDSDELVKISNGNVLRGQKQLEAYWREHLDQVENLQMVIDDIKIYEIDAQHIWAIADEMITIGGQSRKAIVSNIFRLTSSGWRILQDHTTYTNT